MRNSNRLLSFTVMLVLCAACGCGGAGIAPPAPNPGGGPLPSPGGLDPARGDLAYGSVLRTASGLPSGVKLTWTGQAGLTYNVYKSDTSIPDDAVALGAVARTTGVASAAGAASFIDDFSDQPVKPQIGTSWFYRLSAVDSDGDESRLSPELKVDITLHVALSVDKAQAAPGEQVTITGINFGTQDPTDRVLVPGATWTGLAPGGFDLATPLSAQIDSWDATTIVITVPDGFTAGPLAVEINGQSSNSPLVFNNAPYMTSIAPLTGDAGDTVQLTGRNFGGAAATVNVLLGGANASITTRSNTQIDFNPPKLHNFISQPVRVVSDGTNSNAGFFDLNNAPPVVALTVAKAVGYGKLNASFNALGSSDIEDDATGAALTYDYDFDNDGTYDLLGASGSQLHLYSALGTQTCVVRVNDSDGGQAVLSPGVTIEVKPSLAGDWSMTGANPGHSGLSISLAPQAGALPRRRYLANNRVAASPVFASDGTIYAGDISGVFHAYNPDGTDKWRYPLASTVGPIVRTAAVGGNGTIYFADGTGLLFALNPDGTQKWFLAFPQPLSAMVVAVDGTIYIGGSDGNLYALNDIGTGATIAWQRPLGKPLRAAPSLGADDTVYAPCTDGQLYAFKANGAPKWTYPTDSTTDAINASVAIDPKDGTLYFGTDEHVLYAVTDGGTSATKKWAATLSGSISSTPAIGPSGAIYVGTDAGFFHALQADSTPLQQFPPVGGGALQPFTSAAIGSDGKVYVANPNNSIYCLDPVGLTKLWSFDSGFPIFSSPTIGPDGALYFGTDNNDLHALGIANPHPPTATGMSATLKGVAAGEFGAGQTIDFTVLNPTDPERIGLTYDFDLNGDGTSDANGASSSTSFQFNTAGVYNASGKASDANGLSATVGAGPFKVWSATTLAPSAKYVRLAMIAGVPAVAFIVDQGAASTVIMFQNATDATGTAWNAPVIVRQAPGIDKTHDVLDLIDTPLGPAVLYAEDTNLTYRLGTPVAGGYNWNVSGVAFNSVLPSVYKDAALALVNDRPAVCFVVDILGLGVAGEIGYTRANNPNGTSWSNLVPQKLLLGSGGVNCDLAVVGGNPTIAFSGPGLLGIGMRVSYIRALDIDGDLPLGASWPLNFVDMIDIGTGLGKVSVSEIVDPVGGTLVGLAVEQVTSTDVLTFFSGDVLDPSTGTSTTVYGGPINGCQDLAFIGGVPCLAWGTGTGGGPDEFYLARAAMASGALWPLNERVTLHSGASSGTTVSVAAVGGEPAVAYTTGTGVLMYSRRP